MSKRHEQQRKAKQFRPGPRFGVATEGVYRSRKRYSYYYRVWDSHTGNYVGERYGDRTSAEKVAERLNAEPVRGIGKLSRQLKIDVEAQ